MRNAGDSAPLATLLAGKVSSADRGFQAITKLQTPGVVSFTFLIWYVLSSYLWLLIVWFFVENHQYVAAERKSTPFSAQPEA